MGCGAFLGVVFFIGAAFYLWNGITGQEPMDSSTVLIAVALIVFGLIAFVAAARRASRQ